MFKITNVRKTYKVANIEYKSLDSVSITFSNKGLTTLIGKSGNGKTTLLNILGNLDTHTSGEVLFQGIPLSSMSPKQLDSYRNDKIGFIFQSYYLIEHLTVYENVLLALQISNDKKNTEMRILDTLDQLGIKDQAYKLPSELSGGQRQRVAIARAIINKPLVLLCDEPTAALDDEASSNIMNIIKELSKDILVVLVTHNLKIANTYSDRIIEILEGKVLSDTHNNDEIEYEEESEYTDSTANMPLPTIFKLSYISLSMKLKRTLMTVLGACIGIFLLSTVYSLSSGINASRDEMLENDLYKTPLNITRSNYSEDYKANNSVYFTNTDAIRYNIYTSEIFYNVMDDLAEYYSVSINNHYTNMRFLSYEDNQYSFSDVRYYSSISENSEDYSEYLNLVSGDYPSNDNEILLLLDESNNIPSYVYNLYGYDNYSDYVGKELVLASYYSRLQNNDSTANQHANGFNITISGVVAINADYSYEEDMYTVENPFNYADKGFLLTRSVLTSFSEDANGTDRCISYNSQYQQNMSDLDNYEFYIYLNNLRYNGCDISPITFYMFSNSNESKVEMKNYLSNFNNKNTVYLIQYSDTSDTVLYQVDLISSLSFYVISLLSFIALVVSTIMIAIITFTSVIERNKEIGILMAIGASKRNIKQLVTSEALIISILAGVFGILLSFLFSVFLNSVSQELVNIENISVFSLVASFGFMLLCILLSLVAAFYPSLVATKRNAADILREE